MEDEKLRERPRSEILKNIDDYLILSIDGNVVGCVAIHHFEKENAAELACLFVKRGHNGMGYGKILIDAGRKKAKEKGADFIFSLTTQATGYFEKAGFEQNSDLSILPKKRLEEWKKNERNAVLFVRRD